MPEYAATSERRCCRRYTVKDVIFSFDYAMSNTYTETMTETNIAVATHGITKIYGGIRRVDDVSMRVMKGEIYGLIGRNGAGKTTLIRMILGIASPSSGSVELCGAKTPEGLAEMRRRTGALIEQPAFYPRLSAAGNIKAYALAVGLGGIDPAPLLSLVGLGDVGKKQVRNFSLGMKQRLAIAMALAGDPELLFLDEPVNGLDPTGIFEVRELIRTLNAERGVTVVISSHLLGELGRVATAYGVMRERPCGGRGQRAGGSRARGTLRCGRICHERQHGGHLRSCGKTCGDRHHVRVRGSASPTTLRRARRP